MQRIVPNVWCHGNAGDVGSFYADVLPEASMEVVASYPEDDLPDFQRDLAGQPLVVDVSVGGYRIRLINAGDEFRPTPALSFILNFDPALFDGGIDEARGGMAAVWEAFAAGGKVRMALGEYPHSKLYGWVEDKFGVNWQLMLAAPGAERRPAVIPQLLFTGAAAQAQHAMDLYTGLFPESGPGMIVPKPGEAGALLFAEFTLAGQWFSAMDGGPVHDFTFSPGLSLQVDCADQEAIETLWAALSSVPEAEQCGWLVDRFGVSWQIVPQDMGELLQHPGAYQRMLAMKKIVVAEL
ncbi:VOC family protein [Arthrobacter dokdonensis]|uniref:VOC family protein n=1 Tax=Arthrobacter dokdonellae TaxID=2211210 RepID=UPI000DE5AA76|nr:VOC family protein [Arthrobacter dokdonellae]